ncbi:MAG: SWIM zinc finger family protein [Promethearchaeota archaeon]
MPRNNQSYGKNKRTYARSQRDLLDFAETPWGKRWIEGILKHGKYMRMQRAIRYALQNRIFNVIIKKGQIFAQCYGNSPQPYRIKLQFKTLDEKEWQIIENNILKDSKIIASLLSGNLPDELIGLFEESKVSLPLMPELDYASNNLNASCSCPDPAIPCKHIAALSLIMAKIIDYNPAYLLELRGKSIDELIESMEEKRFSKLLGDNKTKIKRKDDELAKERPKIEHNKSIYNLEIPKKICNLSASKLAELINRDKGIYFNISGILNEQSLITSILPELYETQNSDKFKEVLKGIYKRASAESKAIIDSLFAENE